MLVHCTVSTLCFCRFVCVCLSVKVHDLPACTAGILKRRHTILLTLRECDPVARGQSKLWLTGSRWTDGDWMLPLVARQDVGRTSFEYHTLYRRAQALHFTVSVLCSIMMGMKGRTQFILRLNNISNNTRKTFVHVPLLLMSLLLAAGCHLLSVLAIILFICDYCEAMLQTALARFITRAHLSWEPELSEFARNGDVHIICWKSRDVLTKNNHTTCALGYVYFLRWRKRTVCAVMLYMYRINTVLYKYIYFRDSYTMYYRLL